MPPKLILTAQEENTIESFVCCRFFNYGFVTTMSSFQNTARLYCWWLLLLTTWSSSLSDAYTQHNTVNGIIQNPVVSCQDEKKKILCLPLEYSKFDLPYRNDHNLIDIGKCILVSHTGAKTKFLSKNYQEFDA